MMRYKLKEIGKVIGGGTPSTKVKEYYTKNEIGWITPKDLSNYTKKYIYHGDRDITKAGLEHSSAKLLPANSILISSRAPIGYVAIAGNSLATNQGFKSIIPDTSKVLPDYLYYLMLNSKERLEQVASGSTFKEVSGKVMKNFEVEIPSIEKQRKIITILNPITKKMELNDEINANLFKLSNIIFESIIQNEQPTIKFSKIATIQNGFAFKSKEYINDKQTLVLRTKNIGSDHLFNKDDIVYISNKSFNNYRKFTFKPFDTTLVMVGASIGKTGFITSNVIPSLQNQNMWRFRSNKLPGLLIYEYVTFINKNVKNAATGSARSFYRKELFNDFNVPFIDAVYFPIFDKLQQELDNLNGESETLKKLRNVLMNRYF